MITGGCFCGAVRYTAEGPSFHAAICHCTDCRRAVGATAVAWFTVRRDGLRFTGGEPTTYRSSPGASRSFCAHCGTALGFEADDAPEEVDLTIASLDEPDAMPATDHLWTASKLAWEHIGDGLPAYPHGRPATSR